MKFKIAIVTASLALLSIGSSAQVATNNQQGTPTAQSATFAQLDRLAKDITAVNPNSNEMADYLMKAKKYISSDIDNTPSSEKALLSKKRAVLERLNAVNTTNIKNEEVVTMLKSYMAL